MAHAPTAAPDLNHESFQTAFKFAPIGMAFLSLSGQWLRANRALLEILGQTEQDLLATTMEALLYPDDIEPVARYLKNIRDGAILGYQMEVRYQNPRGNPVWVTQSAALVPDADGSPSSLLVQIQNITLRKQAEEALRESEEKFRILVQNQGEGIVMTDTEERFTFANPAAEEIFGVPPGKLAGRKLEDFMAPEQYNEVLEQTWKRNFGEKSSYELEIVRPDGARRSLLVTACPRNDPQGKFLGTFGIFRDITERKRAEEELKRLSRQNELVLRSAAEGILGLDLQGNHTFVNPAAAKMLGYEPEELLGRPSHSTWHHTKPDGSPYPREECPIYAAFRDGAVHRVSTEVFWRKDGASFPVEYLSTPIYEQDRLAGAVVTFTDITLRKRAEEALRESELKYKTLVEGMSEAVMQVDNDDVVQFVNPQFCQLLGYAEDELLGRVGCEIYFDPEQQRLIREKNRLRLERVTDAYETRMRKKSGEEILVRISGSPVTDARGEVTGSIGVLTDITARKQAEEELRDSEHRFRSLASSASDAIISADQDGHIVFWNPGAHRMFGYEEDEVLGRPLVLLMPERFQGLHRQGLERVGKGGASRVMGKTVELAGLRKDGAEFPLELSLASWQQGDETFFTGILRDITLRKRAEEELRESEKKFRVLFEQAADIILLLEITPEGIPVIRDANSATSRLLGYERDELIGRPVSFIDPASDASKVVAERREKVLSGSGKMIFEARHRCKDGAVRDFECSVTEMHVGSKTFAVSVERDVTLRKRAEEALQKSEERYRSLFQSSRDALMTLEPPSWAFTSGNPATVEMFRAKDEQEFIAYGPGQLSPERQPDGRASGEKAGEMIGTAMREGSHFFEWTHRRIDGEEFPATVLLTRMEQAGGLFLQATVRDITESRQAEEERERLIAELQEALAKVKTLSGLLPICASCKKIRDDKGYWEQIEVYIRDRSEADFSHGICPDCAKRLYPQFYEKMMRDKENQP